MGGSPFALWVVPSDGVDDDGTVPWSLPEGRFAKWAVIYAAMAERGWAPHEVDQMWVWQVAMFLGRGHETGSFRPVLKGSRGVALKSDTDDESDGPAFKPGADSALLARLAAYDEAEASGEVLSGRAAVPPAGRSAP